MRRSISHALALGAVLAMLPALAGAQQGATAPSLEQLMSAEEIAATGIARLTPAERASLEQWLVRYTATVTTVVRGMQPSVPTNAPGAAQPVQPAPQQRALPQPLPLPRTAPNGAQVFRSADGGTFIMLDDGSMWEIYFSDRPSAAAWRVGDFVSVHPRAARVGKFNYQLVNANAVGSARVTARYAGYIRVEEAGPGNGGENR